MSVWASPPEAETRASPKVNPRVKMMLPSGVQSRLKASGLPSFTTVGDPPSIGTFFSLRSATNAIHAPSGENTGPIAPSVPARGLISIWSILRTYKLLVPFISPT